MIAVVLTLRTTTVQTLLVNEGLDAIGEFIGIECEVGAAQFTLFPTQLHLYELNGRMQDDTLLQTEWLSVCFHTLWPAHGQLVIDSIQWGPTHLELSVTHLNHLSQLMGNSAPSDASIPDSSGLFTEVVISQFCMDTLGLQLQLENLRTITLGTSLCLEDVIAGQDHFAGTLTHGQVSMQPMEEFPGWHKPLHIQSLQGAWSMGDSLLAQLSIRSNLGEVNFDAAQGSGRINTDVFCHLTPETWPIDTAQGWFLPLRTVLNIADLSASATISEAESSASGLVKWGSLSIPFEWSQATWSVGPSLLIHNEEPWHSLLGTQPAAEAFVDQDNYQLELTHGPDRSELTVKRMAKSAEELRLTWLPGEASNRFEVDASGIQLGNATGANRWRIESDLTLLNQAIQGNVSLTEAHGARVNGVLDAEWGDAEWSFDTRWVIDGIQSRSERANWELFAQAQFRGSGTFDGDWIQILEVRNPTLLENKAPRSFQRFDAIHTKKGNLWGLKWDSDLTNGQLSANSEALVRAGWLGQEAATGESPSAFINATIVQFAPIAALGHLPFNALGTMSIDGAWSEDSTHFHAQIPHLIYEDVTIKGVELSGKLGTSRANELRGTVASIAQNNNVYCSDVKVDLTAESGANTLGGQVEWLSPDRQQAGVLGLELQWLPNHYTLTSNRLSLPLGPETVHLAHPAVIEWDAEAQRASTAGVSLFTSLQNQLNISGSWDATLGANATLDLNWVDFSALASYLPSVQAEQLNGSVRVVGAVADPEVWADLSMERLSWDAFEGNHLLGHVEGTLYHPVVSFSTDLAPNGRIHAEADVPIRQLQDAVIELRFQHIGLNVFNSYLPEESILLQGALDGNLSILGLDGMPAVSGQLTTHETQLAVPYLGTVYDVQGQVVVEPSAFYLNQWQLFDSEGFEAKFNGTVLHDGFADWNLDFGIDANEMPIQMMNMAATDDAYFFGTARCLGDINIAGYGPSLTFDAELRTSEGTVFSLPLDGQSDVSYGDFIRFESMDTPAALAAKPTGDFSNITLNLGIDVDESAEARIIFDRNVGDEIVGRTRGNLDITVDDFERIRMNGQLEIVEGSYYFTLQNWLSKRFDISPGGTIAWQGDPYQAEIDLETKYSTRTRLDPILPNTPDLPGRVPVELQLALSGSLLKPDLGFNIAVPNADSRIQALLDNALLNEEEKQRQALSLLVMNQFFNTDPMESAIGGFLNPTQSTQLLANQLGHWISQISPGVDVGLDYEQNALSGEQALGIAMSTQLLNDRLHIDGAVGAQSFGALHASDMQLQDLTISFDLTADGTVQLTGHARQNQALSNAIEGNQTQGVGIRWKRDFDTWGDWKRQK